MSSTAWLTRRSVSLGLSEHSPARSHRSDEPTTLKTSGRVVASGTDAVRGNAETRRRLMWRIALGDHATVHRAARDEKVHIRAIG